MLVPATHARSICPWPSRFQLLHCPPESQELQRRVQTGTTSRRDCLRARIVLLRAQGMKQQDVARTLGASIVCGNKWSQRFERQGLPGLQDKPGRGRPCIIALGKIEQILAQGGSAAGVPALEHPHADRRGRGVRSHRTAYLAPARSRTALEPHAQALAGLAVQGAIPGRYRLVR